MCRVIINLIVIGHVNLVQASHFHVLVVHLHLPLAAHVLQFACTASAEMTSQLRKLSEDILRYVQLFTSMQGAQQSPENEARWSAVVNALRDQFECVFLFLLASVAAHAARA